MVMGANRRSLASGMIKLSQRRQEWSESWMLGLSLFSWLAWATGSFLGECLQTKSVIYPSFYKPL